MFAVVCSVDSRVSGGVVTCWIRRQSARARVDGWLPSCGLITDAVITITIIIITVMITVGPSSLPHQPHPPTPAALSTGERIDIHLGPYTGRRCEAATAAGHQRGETALTCTEG